MWDQPSRVFSVVGKLDGGAEGEGYLSCSGGGSFLLGEGHCERRRGGRG